VIGGTRDVHKNRVVLNNFMKNVYSVNLFFKKRQFQVFIKPYGDGFDLKIRTKKPLSGEDFQALKHYLIEEGYVDAAKDWGKF
jgi:hypothetical protein